MEEPLVSSTNCESDPRDLFLPRTLTDVDQLKYRCVYLLLLYRRRPCRACFSDSFICFGYECDLRYYADFAEVYCQSTTGRP